MTTMINKKALITGITGQDGSFLTELLLKKGYQVHGIKRRSSSFNTARIDHLYQDEHELNRNLILHYGDLTDATSLTRIIQAVQPDEIYNLGAMSHVAVSFETPEYTADVNGLGTLRILEAIRLLGLTEKCRFYQASSSELYGLIQANPQAESTPFYPRSPYAISKLFAYWTTINYREAFGVFACNGILFNHESSRRGETFVTRKITRGLTRICAGVEPCLYLGNLDAKRDWGHARDYVEMQWLMLQQEQPSDYVIATGLQYSVREFVELTAKYLGIELSWQGDGVESIATIINGYENHPALSANQVVVRIDPGYFRPTEVDTLCGNPEKAHRELGWQPKTSIDQLIAEMVDHDLAEARSTAVLKSHGLRAPEH